MVRMRYHEDFHERKEHDGIQTPFGMECSQVFFKAIYKPM